VGPREHPENVAAPKGAEKWALTPRDGLSRGHCSTREAPGHVLLLCTEHSEQETGGQHRPLGAGFWPFFPKGNGNLSPKHDFIQETKSGCRSGVEKSFYGGQELPACRQFEWSLPQCDLRDLTALWDPRSSKRFPPPARSCLGHEAAAKDVDALPLQNDLVWLPWATLVPQ